jgi:hypothetical protein
MEEIRQMSADVIASYNNEQKTIFNVVLNSIFTIVTYAKEMMGSTKDVVTPTFIILYHLVQENVVDCDTLIEQSVCINRANVKTTFCALGNTLHR